MDNSKCYWYGVYTDEDTVQNLCYYDSENVTHCKIHSPCMKFINRLSVKSYTMGEITYDDLLARTLEEYWQRLSQMRLIDANNFVEILSEIRAQYSCFDRDEIAGYEAISEALEKLKEVSTIELVHCGNCIYGEPHENNVNEIICINDWGLRSKWGYCSDGERKEV